MVKFSSDYDALVGSIYDCAANPELWPETCVKLREALAAAYVVVGFLDLTDYSIGRTKWHRRSSPWDQQWLDALDDLIPSIPNGNTLYELDPDIAWTQLGCMPEHDFRETDFYRQWVEPQELRDTLNIKYVSRHKMLGLLGAPTLANREPVSSEEKALAESLSPHIRRAILINDLTDKGKLALTLYQHVLDTLSVAVFVVGLGQRLVFTNAAGDKMLSEGEYFTRAGGALQARREAGQAAAFEAAVDRALMGDMAIGMSGIGVPLVGSDGDRVAAYVLPIAGKDVRGALGPGHCAVFVAKRGEQQPMLIEVLRTMFDLTVTEARVVMLLAKGDGPQTIAESLQISVNTVRTHLKHAYAKTDTPDQTALVALIHTVLPPVAVA